MGIARRLAANGVRAVRRALAGQPVPASSGCWIVVECHGGLAERSGPGLAGPALGLLDVLRCFEAAGRDPRVEGVLLRFDGELGSFSQALSLRRAIRQLREAGKATVVWAESLSAEQYLAASAATRIWLPESGSLFLVGLRTERFFVRELLEKIGARPEVVHIGKFKSAGDGFTRDSMSEEEREQIESWQTDLFDELVSGIAEGRGLEPEAVRRLIDEGPHGAAAAADSGLVDGLVYADEVLRQLEPLSREPAPGRSGARRVHAVDAVDYFSAIVADAGWQPLLRDRPALVYLVASGSISRGSGLGGIRSRALGKLLAELRIDRRVRGVLLRLESPGGDALASDLLHRELWRLTREKPVVVSMGDVVASGGYYIAAAADCVLAEASSITGSIGVVGGKLDLARLYERIGVSKDGVQTGRRAGLLSEARGYDADERAAVRREMQAVYETFLARVAAGRSLSRSELEKIAQGRIWSGRRAHTLGLIDGLGGPLDALAELAGRAGLQPDEPYTLITLPRTSRLSELLPLLAGGEGPRGRILARVPWHTATNR